MIDVNELKVGCIVEDARGAPISGLRKEDFAARIDGIESPVRMVGTDTSVPIHVALLVDVSLSQKNMLGHYANALKSIGEHLQAGRDTVSVYTFGGAVTLVHDWEDIGQFRATSVAEIDPKKGQVLKRRPPPFPGGTLLFDAVLVAARRFNGMDGRKAILVLTDGIDEGSTSNASDLLRLTEVQGISVSALEFGAGPLAVANPSFLLKEMHDALALDSQRTGGILLHAKAG